MQVIWKHSPIVEVAYTRCINARLSLYIWDIKSRLKSLRAGLLIFPLADDTVL